MLFNSLQFALFLPVVFVVYWLLRRSLRWQNLFVVAVSYLFYGWWDPRFLLLIAFTSACSYLSGLAIGRARGEGRDGKDWMWANVAVNLLVLCVFKYYDFFAQSFADVFLGGRADGLLLHLVLPVGISFYTFQALSYSIDVYRSKIEPTRDPIAFFAYVAFFPQLVAGPIERATNLLPQFQKTRTFDYAEAVEGCRRILWGLFKKMVIADNCAIYVDSVWKDYASQSGSTLVLAAILFAFQIYGDFSGYSDIAIGTAKLFGINLRDNFLTPYFSRNVAEFWKRWHISLNTWFVDYVYIPLGGSREGRWNTVRNTFVIFLLSGLWHGANWTYVGWGAYHALLFVPLIWLGATKKYIDTATWKHIPQMVLTFGLVVLGWIIFRAPSIADAWQYVVAICDKSLLSVPWLINRQFYIPLLISILLLFLFEWKGRKKGYGLAWLRGKRGALQLAVYYLFMILIYVWQSSEDIQFIYFQF
jgi:D-alanyl-lipoteichoic acid acyltransferase DltB (MBOAT superfamily)